MSETVVNCVGKDSYASREAAIKIFLKSLEDQVFNGLKGAELDSPLVLKLAPSRDICEDRKPKSRIFQLSYEIDANADYGTSMDYPTTRTRRRMSDSRDCIAIALIKYEESGKYGPAYPKEEFHKITGYLRDIVDCLRSKKIDFELKMSGIIFPVKPIKGSRSGRITACKTIEFGEPGQEELLLAKYSKGKMVVYNKILNEGHTSGIAKVKR